MDEERYKKIGQPTANHCFGGASKKTWKVIISEFNTNERTASKRTQHKLRQGTSSPGMVDEVYEENDRSNEYVTRRGEDQSLGEEMYENMRATAPIEGHTSGNTEQVAIEDITDDEIYETVEMTGEEKISTAADIVVPLTGVYNEEHGKVGMLCHGIGSKGKLIDPRYRKQHPLPKQTIELHSNPDSKRGIAEDRDPLASKIKQGLVEGNKNSTSHKNKESGGSRYPNKTTVKKTKAANQISAYETTGLKSVIHRDQHLYETISNDFDIPHGDVEA